MNKEVFVIAGPNGAGKTSSTKDMLPSGVQSINGDLIHFELFGTHTSSLITSQEANTVSKEMMQKLIKEEASFSYESNLVKSEEWDMLKALQAKGYAVSLYFMSVNDPKVLNERIEGRVKAGKGHYVDPVIVEQRYAAGLKQLDHNFNVPENSISQACWRTRQENSQRQRNGLPRPGACQIQRNAAKNA